MGKRKQYLVKKILKKIYKKDGQDRLLPRFSLFVFDRSRTMAILWLCLTVFGVVSYTTLLQREGFPSINIPYSVVGGAYFVNDPKKVDAEITKPIGEIVLKDDRVKGVQASAQAMSYHVFVQYEEDTDATKVGKEIERRIKEANVLPERATMEIQTPKIGFTQRGDDAVISVYSKENGASIEDLTAEGERLVSFLKDKNLPDVEDISVIEPFVEAQNAATGKDEISQTNFDRYGERVNGQNRFYASVSVGLSQKDGTDVITLDDKIKQALGEYNKKNADSQYYATVSATHANDIKEQVNGLQKSLLEGLLAVLVVGSLVIAIRASIITVLAMLTVLSITLGVLYGIGYTLNTITLFSLILCMGLIVDDTIIMVEAIDAQRRRRKDPRETIHVATKKVSRAMVAATTTAALSFAPLLFVGGILGGFIRAIPVTVITSLVVSLLVALIFIPLFARYLLLGKKQMGAKNVHEPAAGIEAKVAEWIGKPMLWARHSLKKLALVGSIAVVIGLAFIMAAGVLFQKVEFNIFPTGKDNNALSVQLTFEQGTAITEAENIADRANSIIARELGENFKNASFYTNADNHTASLTVYLLSLHKRDITSIQLEDRLDKQFKNFSGATVEVGQLGVGPPSSEFTVQIRTEDREAGLSLAKDISRFLMEANLERTSGEKAEVVRTAVSDPGTYDRDDGKAYVSASATFKDTDTSTLVALAEDAVNKEFNAKKLESYGLGKNVLHYDLGQEEENQDSFKTLAMAFPILLLVIYLLLSIQFRSLLQPLLIFMAIPFSLFGISLGLYLTDNPFSFFAMLGFFALLGLSIKNTILLTDYANQLRREGVPAVDAAVGALAERFRPLIATSFTAVVSLIPLMLSDPFWEGLTVVLIFGLLSSTFLVITVFPYYYLGAEFLRLHVSRKAALLWLALTIGITVLLSMAGVNPAVAPLIAIVVGVVESILIRKRRQRRA
jgi:multidrug efflux pump subunit AcrB